MDNHIDTDKKVIDHIGRITQILHDSLRELGYDQRLKQVSSEIASSKDGLTYITSQTTRAAEHSLQTVENIRPIQENLSENASNLSRLWSQASERAQSAITDQPALKDILEQTLGFLNNIPEQTAATQTHLTEIIMAQDFHDLTGQVIQEIAQTIEAIEQEILQLLIDSSSAKKEVIVKQHDKLMNGPVINPQKQNDAVSSQDQVDNLLTELGL